MTKRKTLSKRLRFEVFKRDGFACQYCGKKAPDVVLHVDHINPVAAGGSNELLNLVTACEACNAGKSNKPLSDNAVVERQRTQLEALTERREQIDMMLQWQSSLIDLEEETTGQVAEMFARLVPGRCLSASGKAKFKKWVKKFGAEEVVSALRASVDQYLALDGEPALATLESASKVIEYVPRICSCTRRELEEPGLRDIFYIRGIVRRRFPNCKDWLALKLLREAHQAGWTIEELKESARVSHSWTTWVENMQTAIGVAESRAAG